MSMKRPPLMFGTVGVLLFLAAIGLGVAVLSGVATTFRELAMLLEIGGWPGRLAAVHGLVWLIAILYVDPQTSDWVFGGVAIFVFLGTVAAPFYANNRRFLETIRAHDEAASPADLSPGDGDYVPVTGTVVFEEKPSKSVPWTLSPVTSPFTATKCAACEWAVKKRQRISRRTTYTTVDHGAEAGDFAIETGNGRIGVTPDDPKLFLFSDVALTGYGTTTTDPMPAGERSGEESGVLSSVRSSELKYCETTVDDGDTVTVIGPVENARGEYERYPTIDDASDTVYVVDSGFDEVKRIVENYLRWAPHAAVATFSIGWFYVGVLALP